MLVIVTVYNSSNYGSYLQARALYDVLSSFEDTCFLNVNQRSNFGILQLKLIIISLIKYRSFKKALFYYYKFYNSYLAWKKLPSCNKKDINNIENVTFIIGSDEIWNISRQSCSNPIFWGDGLNGRIISYAPSANNASISIVETETYRQYINKFNRLSVRDNRTLSLIQQISDKDVSIVLDPTFLFDKDYYFRDVKKEEFDFEYIAVYLFEKKLKHSDIFAIRKFAKEKHCKLVSIGPWIDWCDVNVLAISNNPFLYYDNAKYVITNTFHGTAFAINFECQFVTYSYNNCKVNELVNLFGLSCRDLSLVSSGNIRDIFSKPIDYSVVNKIKNKMRKNSLEYLRNSILL